MDLNDSSKVVETRSAYNYFYCANFGMEHAVDALAFVDVVFVGVQLCVGRL